MNWYIEVLKKYTVFTGRARRQEYWYFVLFNFLFSFVLGLADGLVGLAEYGSPLSSLYSIAVLVPGIAVGIRRMHDTGRSGWWLLVPIVSIFFLAQDSQPGANQYGSNPKEGGLAATAATSPAGWLTDPTGRHELRYWDGTSWTDNVSDRSVTSKDPVDTAV